MELSLSHEQGYVLVQLRGAVDDSAAEPFSEHLHPLIAKRGTRMLIDLSNVERMTSQGLSQLVGLVTRSNTNSGRIVMFAPTPFVASLFSVTRLDRLFELASDLPAAQQTAGVEAVS